MRAMFTIMAVFLLLILNIKSSVGGQTGGSEQSDKQKPQKESGEIPAEYLEYCLQADSIYNANGDIDCNDEVIESVRIFANRNRSKDKIRHFIEFLALNGHELNFIYFLSGVGCLDNIIIPEPFAYDDVPLDADSISERRIILNEKIRQLDTLINRNNIVFNDFDHRGAELVLKLKSENTNFKVLAQVLKFGKDHDAEYQERNKDEKLTENPDAEEDMFKKSTQINGYNKLDLDLLIESLNYLADGRRLMREQYTLYETKRVWKRSDQQLDEISKQAMDAIEIKLETDGSSGAIAGLNKSALPKSSEEDVQLNLKDIKQPMEELKKFSQMPYKSRTVEEINNKLIGLQIIYDDFLSKIENFNTKLAKFNAKVDSQLSLSEKLQMEMKENQNRLEILTKEQEALSKEQEKADYAMISATTWGHFTKISDLKQSSWETYRKCYEHDKLLQELNAEWEALQQEIKVLNEANQEFVSEKKKLDKEKDRIYEKFGLNE